MIPVDDLKKLIQDRLKYRDCNKVAVALIKKAGELSNGLNDPIETDILKLYELVKSQPNGGINVDVAQGAPLHIYHNGRWIQAKGVSGGGGASWGNIPSGTAILWIYQTFDSFFDIPLEDQKARLDIFAVSLQREPTSKGYIIVYAGRCAFIGEARARADQAKEYLIRERSINAGRIATIDGGHREKLTVESYLLPPEAPEPSTTPTIAPSEVQIIKQSKAMNGNRYLSKSRCK